MRGVYRSGLFDNSGYLLQITSGDSVNHLTALLSNLNIRTGLFFVAASVFHIVCQVSQKNTLFFVIYEKYSNSSRDENTVNYLRS